MAGYWIVGMLAAFGLLCALWAVLGCLATGGKGCAVVCLDPPGEEILARFILLKGLGLLDCPLLAVTGEAIPVHFDEIEICSPEDLLPRLTEERKRFDGTGNGDHTGRHQRRGISEL